jgi:hypothetical protein
MTFGFLEKGLLEGGGGFGPCGALENTLVGGIV